MIWLLQTVFLSSFYQGMKVNSVKSVADEISAAYGQVDFALVADRLVYQNSLLIYITDTSGNLLYTSDEHASGGEFASADRGNGGDGGSRRSLPIDYGEFLSRLQASEEGYISYIEVSDNNVNTSLVYGKMLGNEILYISTPIDPLDATIGILRQQLVYITIVTLLAGLVIAFFISKKLAKPIARITESAEVLASGDYSVQFEKGDYSEIDALAKTLNYTAGELSKVESLRRELIANISHDLRTPLTMIKGYTEMIEEVSGNDGEKRARHLSIIKEETSRLENLVGDILNLSVLQSGNTSIDKQNINISEMVRDVLVRFETLLGQDGFRFKKDIQLDLYALADATRMEQVLYNLIGNAVNHVGDDKTVGVCLKDSGSSIRLEVHDNGSGIAEDELPYIWDRYYKSKERPRSKAGTGIGLSIVKSILLMHDAQFGVKSELGRGSVFWLELRK
jgi:signal transduction histidine kinase